MLTLFAILIDLYLVKFSFSEKATKIWSYHPLDLTTFTYLPLLSKGKCEIKRVIILNFCGLLRKAELYLLYLVSMRVCLVRVTEE
jgi:hypothetical protein